jgi:GDP-L-fucose synthase
MAEGCIYLMNLSKSKFYNSKKNNPEHINLGSGYEVSIFNLSKIISKIIGYKGKIVFNTSKPNGTKRKLLDSSRVAKMGWKPKIKIRQGIEQSYKDFLNKNDKR